jgi:hypothetical protein
MSISHSGRVVKNCDRDLSDALIFEWRSCLSPTRLVRQSGPSTCQKLGMLTFERIMARFGSQCNWETMIRLHWIRFLPPIRATCLSPFMV